MSKLLVVRGLPGSGKTTFAKSMQEWHDFVPVSRDDLRVALYGPAADHKQLDGVKEITVTHAETGLVRSLLEHGHNVVEHSMNLRNKYVKGWMELAGEVGAEFDVADLTDVSVEDCVVRDRNRPGWVLVGEPVIRELYQKFVKGKPYPLPLPETEETPQFARVFNDSRKRSAIIVDIDGTVAHNDGARGWYEEDKVHLDKPHADIVRMVRWLLDLKYHVIFMSGRSTDCETATRTWIKAHVLQPWHSDDSWELHMRASGDKRGDAVVKHELFERYVEGEFYIEYVLDDRDSVVKMWRQIGLRCLQVADGAF